MIQNQFNAQIKIIRSDNGKEYFNQTLIPILQAKWIIHQSTCPNTPQQNGVQRERTDIYLKPPEPYCFKEKSQNTTRGKQL